MIQRKQNKRIANPWFVEIDFRFNNNYYCFSSQNDDTVLINLINENTGEIRQKRVSIDTIARRVFESEIKNMDDVHLEDVSK